VLEARERDVGESVRVREEEWIMNKSLSSLLCVTHTDFIFIFVWLDVDKLTACVSAGREAGHFTGDFSVYLFFLLSSLPSPHF
jgi:hypothetical protein